MAVAAIATSLLLARGRQEDEFLANEALNGEPPAQQPLDAIRAAGL